MREQLIAKLDELNEEQINTLLHTANWLIESDKQAAAYDESKDALIGFISADPELSVRAKEILRADYGLKKAAEPEAK